MTKISENSLQKAASAAFKESLENQCGNVGAKYTVYVLVSAAGIPWVVTGSPYYQPEIPSYDPKAGNQILYTGATTQSDWLPLPLQFADGNSELEDDINNIAMPKPGYTFHYPDVELWKDEIKEALQQDGLLTDKGVDWDGDVIDCVRDAMGNVFDDMAIEYYMEEGKEEVQDIFKEILYKAKEKGFEIM